MYDPAPCTLLMSNECLSDGVFALFNLLLIEVQDEQGKSRIKVKLSRLACGMASPKRMRGRNKDLEAHEFSIFTRKFTDDAFFGGYCYRFNNITQGYTGSSQVTLKVLFLVRIIGEQVKLILHTAFIPAQTWVQNRIYVCGPPPWRLNNV